jgi:hypothetical protein
MWTVPWYQDLQQLKGEIMGEVETRLGAIRDKLVEASDEIVGVLGQLRQQVADNAVDPATLDQLDQLAGGLADIVPNTPAE